MSVDCSTIDILGTRVHLVRSQQVLDIVECWIKDGPKKCRFVVNTGFHGLHIASNNQDFQNIVNSADLFSPDGIAAVWIARLLGKKLKKRATSAEMMQMFFEKADKCGYKSFFYGDTDETLEALRINLENKYPGHKIVGTYSPPFRQLTQEEDESIVKMINESKADVLWVGLGLPKQEKWICEHKDHLHIPVAIGVGACFGFYSQKVKRVPAWIGDSGFEWLWRLFLEPRKLWRRDLLDGPKFLLTIMKNWPAIRKANS